MQGIYLASCKARHPNYNLVYQDIEKDLYNCDLGGDMLEVDLSQYDYIIASPPCNYYSRANYRRYTSEYSQKTKHLLPAILQKCCESGKPFIIENVRSPRLFDEMGVTDIENKYGIFRYVIGRHTYWTNILINMNCPQELDFHNKNTRIRTGCRFERQDYRQGGDNVHSVIEIWLKYINETTNNISLEVSRVDSKSTDI